MASVKARVLETIIDNFHSPALAGLNYVAKTNKLVIYYHSDGKQDIDYEIVFDNPRGFKMLDEGDMCNYWEDAKMINNWLFEIESGGWLDTEDAAGGFSSKALGFKEFLVASSDDCVSVISNCEPEIIKLHKI